jgi:hypothetical protein
MQGFSDWTMQRFMYSEANLAQTETTILQETPLQLAIKKIRESHESKLPYDSLLSVLYNSPENSLENTINQLQVIITELSIYKE